MDKLKELKIKLDILNIIYDCAIPITNLEKDILEISRDEFERSIEKLENQIEILTETKEE